MYLIGSIQACCMMTLYLIGKRDKTGSGKRWECLESSTRFFPGYTISLLARISFCREHQLYLWLLYLVSEIVPAQA